MRPTGTGRSSWVAPPRSGKFDGSDRLPDPAAVAELLPLIGFGKIRWQAPRITLPPGMEIDFGGFAKEYAVDRILAIVRARFGGAALVDFSGDLACNGVPADGPWQVGIEGADAEAQPLLLLELSQGSVATISDTRNFLARDGVRYGDILDVRDGWPVAHAPRALTVAADSCLEAGRLVTLAMLRGSAAETFLREQGVPHWCLRWARLWLIMGERPVLAFGPLRSFEAHPGITDDAPR